MGATFQFSLPVQEILKVQRRHGYDLVTAVVGGPDYGGPWVPMKAAFNWRGEYIGDPRTAKRLVEQRGILPEIRPGTTNVCSIGYSLKDGKWYGWSHRAIYGFKGRNAKRQAMRFASRVS